MSINLGPGITIRIRVDGGGDVRSVNGIRPDAEGNVALETGVQTVNGIAPDAEGNVEVDIAAVVMSVLIALDAVDVVQDEDGALLVDYDDAILLN